jgi:hypothetical protein
MSNSGIPVKLQPRAAACKATTIWHSESALLVCSFEYGADPVRQPPTVSQRIDAALGISTSAPRALLGEVDLTWQNEDRLGTLELRTSPNQWEPTALPTPTGRIEASTMTLELEYDINRIARIDVDVCTFWDTTQATIALCFGSAEREKGRWVAIADSVFVRVDDERALAEIRLMDVRMVPSDPS